MKKYCEGRLHAWSRGEGKDIFGVGRSFDQHEGWIERVERIEHARGGAWPMMADAEEMDAIRGRHITSRMES
jgi:hypothetical protein